MPVHPEQSCFDAATTDAASVADAASALRIASRIVIATHINPDGDTLGSALALAHALERMGKQITVLSHDGVPDIYRWMPGCENVRTSTDERGFDLAVVCDTSTIDRVGRAREPVESAVRSLNVDHHASEGDFGDVRLVDSRAAATGELIFALLRELGADLDRDIADCLLCAIITDTGSFRYLNVTPQTLRIAAELMVAGACPAAISELVFENRSYASLKLLGRALGSLETCAGGRAAWAHVTAADFAALGATDEETEGIVNHVRAVRGTEIAALFREIPGKQVRISLRARDGYDVNRIAAVFGGGGHRLAAGCSVDPPLEAAERAVLTEIERALGDHPE